MMTANANGTPSVTRVPAMQLTGVHAYYGRSHVLHGVDLAVASGEVTCMFGRNGVGKTTTLACAMGLLRIAEGVIEIGGQTIRPRDPHRVAKHGVTLVPEGRWIFTSLTVEENLRLAWRLGRQRPDYGLDDAYAYFPDLKTKRAARAGQLSGGQQQMLALGRALVTGPDVVLLDEPTQGLAPQYVEMVMEYVRLLRSRGVSVLLVEQNLHVALPVADHVVLMDHGHVGFAGTAQELASNEYLLERYLSISSATNTI